MKYSYQNGMETCDPDKNDGCLNLIIAILILSIILMGTIVAVKHAFFEPIYKVVVTGTQNGCACKYEVWRYDTIVHKVNNCK
jgi:hypothetical protein